MTAVSHAAVARSLRRRRRPVQRRVPAICACAAVMALSACASAPPPAPVVTPPPSVPREDKLAWIVRLEDARVIRDDSVPEPPPAPGAVDAPPASAPPSDLIRLLDDRDGVVRARAALGLGRVGLPDAIAPLTARLSDPQVPVREMAAFALGLIGDAAARPGLTAALTDAAPAVQGRAAEALGLIGDRADAPAVAAMVRGHLTAGALDGIDPDDLGHPLAPPVEAVRLGLYALTRLNSFDDLASVALAGGRPVSRWWPVAYALQRVNDPRGGEALLALLDTPGRFTPSFAAKGLSNRPSPEATAALARVIEEGRAHPMVVVQAMRSLAASGSRAVVPALLRMVGAAATDPTLRTEAMTAFGTLAGREHVDILLDLLSHRLPAVRADAIRALARVDADVFLTSLASLDADPEWRVRAAQAQALGTIPAAQARPRLIAMLGDADARVVPAVLAAIAAAGIADGERLVSERLAAPDFAVRAAAATALADMKARGSVPAIVAAYRAAREERPYTARAAMLLAIHRLDPAAARPLLVESLEDRDWAVRVRAASLLREQGAEPAAARPLRPAVRGPAANDPEWRRIVFPPYSPRAFIDTSKGTIELELSVVDTPLTTHNFVTLARKGFFDNAPVHRIVPDFVVQDGDPRGDGEGGPGYTIRDELTPQPYLRGTLGMALDWEDTGGSQFFITHSPQPHLDARYTAFGRVVEGMDVVDRLVPSDVIRRVRIEDGVTP